MRRIKKLIKDKGYSGWPGNLNYLFFIALVILLGYGCKRKVNLKIKDQSKQYVVIFGIITDDVTTNFVNVSRTGDFAMPGENRVSDAVLQVETPFSMNFFINNGNGSYATNIGLEANSPYRFICVEGSDTHVYQIVTGAPVVIHSLQCTQQSDGKYTVNAPLSPATSFAFFLRELYIGKVAGAGNVDTTWKKYSEAFPKADPKLNFMAPVLLLKDSTQLNTYEIIKNAALEQGDIIRLEIYSIDPATSQYLALLNAPDNFNYDPLSIAPPSNYFAFSNSALGIIIPAIKTRKIAEVK